MNGRPPMRPRRQRFASATEGAAAVEFALVVGPFLFLIFAVLELALVFLLSTSLDTATERAARRIRTGEVQTSGEAAAAYKTALCSQMTWLSDNCDAALRVDVRKYDQFPDTNVETAFKTCTKPDGTTYQCMADDAEMQWQPGGPTDVVVVRTYYQWPLFTPFLNQALSRLDGGVAVVQSTQTFRNEPYA